MQKKIIALAVAALASSAAFAQTNVTIYGVIDVQEAFVKSSGATNGVNQSTVSRLDAHGNYIGFKGVEDLGNGLKAVFLYESALYADNGGGLAGGRDAYVGLTGGFGTVVAGNLTHPLRAFGAKVDLLPGAAGFGTTASLTGEIAGTKTGADDRASNAVAYVSPSFSGFSGTAAYINGETQPNGANTGEARAYQLAGQYENGPAFAGVGYHKADNIGGVADAEARVWRLAGTYTLPSNTKLTALYDNTKVENGSAYDKRQALSLGVAQSFGKNTVGLQYAHAFKTKDETGSLDKTAANLWTLQYGYTLSKRTMLHARLSRLSNNDNVNYTFYNMPVNNGVATGAGSNYTGVSFGLRHTF